MPNCPFASVSVQGRAQTPLPCERVQAMQPPMTSCDTNGRAASCTST